MSQLYLRFTLQFKNGLSSVSTLVLFASDDNDQTFEEIIKDQIKKLRKQLDKPKGFLDSLSHSRAGVAQPSQSCPPKPDAWEATRSRAAQLAAALGQTGRVFTY